MDAYGKLIKKHMCWYAHTWLKQILRNLHGHPSWTHVLIFALKTLSNSDWFVLCSALRKKCPYSELFWYTFFPHLDGIRKDTEYLSVFSPNARKCGKNADQNNSKYGKLLRRGTNSPRYKFSSSIKSVLQRCSS